MNQVNQEVVEEAVMGHLVEATSLLLQHWFVSRVDAYWILSLLMLLIDATYGNMLCLSYVHLTLISVAFLNRGLNWLAQYKRMVQMESMRSRVVLVPVAVLSYGHFSSEDVGVYWPMEELLSVPYPLTTLVVSIGLIVLAQVFA